MVGDPVFVRLCDRPIPRLLRLMHVARELGYRPIFVGAFREEGRAAHDSWDGWEVRRIGPYFPLVNGTRALLYVVSVLRYGIALFMHLMRQRPVFVHVSDFEAYWPARIYAWLARRPLIYNIHDNLSQRYACGKGPAFVLNTLEGMAAALATASTVPEAFRATALPAWCRSNVYVVKNAPFDPGCRPPQPATGDKCSILYGGWIDKGRGIRPMIDMVANSSRCELILAGEGDADLVAEAEQSERVDFRGYMPNEDVIQETERCDFVAALYDPARPINCFAASNKIGEALAVGRPLIINEEQEIANLLREHDCAFITKYAQADQIGDELFELRQDTERYEGMCRRARELYEEQYAWEIIFEASVKLYDAAGIREVGRDSMEGGLRPKVTSH